MRSSLACLACRVYELYGILMNVPFIIASTHSLCVCSVLSSRMSIYFFCTWDHDWNDPKAKRKESAEQELAPPRSGRQCISRYSTTNNKWTPPSSSLFPTRVGKAGFLACLLALTIKPDQKARLCLWMSPILSIVFFFFFFCSSRRYCPTMVVHNVCVHHGFKSCVAFSRCYILKCTVG